MAFTITGKLQFRVRIQPENLVGLRSPGVFMINYSTNRSKRLDKSPTNIAYSFGPTSTIFYKKNNQSYLHFLLNNESKQREGIKGGRIVPHRERAQRRVPFRVRIGPCRFRTLHARNRNRKKHSLPPFN